MNIKRFVVVALSLVFALSFTCSAVDWDAYYYQNEDGSYGHDYESYKHDLAAEMVAERGLNLDVSQYWTPKQDSLVLEYYFDFEAFQNDYDAMIAALPPKDVPSLDEGATAADPLGGSAVEAPEEAPLVEEPVIEEPVIEEPVIEEPVIELSEVELDVLEADAVVDNAYLVHDLRDGLGGDSANYAAEDGGAVGLKAVIRSIFGEYRPVTTTAVYSETVDGDVVTSLVDVVASGTAGVDWEYVSGVFLFGLILFCLFKLLGGIVS